MTNSIIDRLIDNTCYINKYYHRLVVK